MYIVSLEVSSLYISNVWWNEFLPFTWEIFGDTSTAWGSSTFAFGIIRTLFKVQCFSKFVYINYLDQIEWKIGRYPIRWRTNISKKCCLIGLTKSVGVVECSYLDNPFCRPERKKERENFRYRYRQRQHICNYLGPHMHEFNTYIYLVCKKKKMSRTPKSLVLMNSILSSAPSSNLDPQHFAI